MSSTPHPAFPPLVCPVHRQPLMASGAASLACGAGHEYPIALRIPRVLAAGSNYADAFGEQWKRFRTTQLDSYSKISISRDRLRRCMGEELWSRLGQGGRFEILEAGCGAGRFTEPLLSLAGAAVTSTDLSAAVEPNQENCPQSQRHRIVQCDINALPFLPQQYDVVICLGVVQHTRSPEQTIASLFAQVRPGGWLVIDHYTHNLSRYTKLGALVLRPIMKRLSPQRGLAATQKVTDLFFPMHRAARRSRLLQIALSRISPLATYFHTIPQLDDRLQYEWALLDTHDVLTDYYKRLRTGPQLRSTLERLGATAIWVNKGGNGIEVRCQRPA